MKQGQQSWEYNHVDLAWPIVHAFLPLDKELNDTPLLKQKLSSLSYLLLQIGFIQLKKIKI